MFYSAHKIELEKQKEMQRAKDIAMIKLFKKEQKKSLYKNECIEKAKTMIFDDSCYGRRLISALLESKTLEERDAQIVFKKKLKEEAKDYPDNTTGCYLKTEIDMEKEEKEKITLQREKNEKYSNENKAIYITQNKEKKKNKTMQIQAEVEDMKLIERLIEKERAEDIKRKSIYKQGLDQARAERKKYEERKAKIEDTEERIAAVWRNFESKKNNILKAINQKRIKKINSNENIKLIKKIHYDEKARYDEFINKGITQKSERLSREDDVKRNKECESNKQHVLMQENKKLAEAKRINETNIKKCVCEKQSLFTKSKDNRNRNMQIWTNVTAIKHGKKDSDITSQQKRPILLMACRDCHQGNDVPTVPPTKNTLVQNLKMKEKEASPWSGSSATDAQFAQRAGETLQQCRYKRMARKVVDDYRRLNGLTSQTLPVSNY